MTTAEQLDEQVRQSMQAGEPAQAVQLCEQLNARFPEYAQGWFTASQLALTGGKPRIGIEAIDRALSLVPDRPDWLLQRVACMNAAGDKAGARALAHHLLAHRFDNAVLASHFGWLLAQVGLHDEAVRQCRRAAELEPGNSQYQYNLATALRLTGDTDGALAALEACLQLDPDSAEARLLGADLLAETTGTDDIEAVAESYARSADDPGTRLRLCYSLAEALDELGRYDRAFEYLAEGAALRRRQIDYEPADDIAAMQAIQATIGEEQIGSSALGYVNAEPIFVVGMPCTGSKLVQNVLCAHSVVQEAGAPGHFSEELLKHCRQAGAAQSARAPELLMQTRSIDYASLGEAYVKAARPSGGSKAHFVDSTPGDFMYAGMIHMALPKARIILLRRQPMDTCYDAFRTLFGQGYPYSYDLEELAQYFVTFDRLTSHWLRLMPEAMHVVSYEELVCDPRPVIEHLLDYCSLSFEEECLGFFDDRPGTGSAAAEVRGRGSSRASIGAWRNYEKQLQPVASTLQDAGIALD